MYVMGWKCEIMRHWDDYAHGCVDSQWVVWEVKVSGY